MAKPPDDPGSYLRDAHLFVDTRNLYHMMKRSFGADQVTFPDFEVSALITALEARISCKVSQSRVYSGIPSEQICADPVDRGLFDAASPALLTKARAYASRMGNLRKQVLSMKRRFNSLERVKVFTKNCVEKETKMRCTKCAQERPHVDVHESGIDVLIAMDMIESAVFDHVPVIILVSSDQDFDDLPQRVRHLLKRQRWPRAYPQFYCVHLHNQAKNPGDFDRSLDSPLWNDVPIEPEDFEPMLRTPSESKPE